MIGVRHGDIRVDGGVTAALSATAAVFVGVPLLLALITGSLAVPHNDAWSYSRIGEMFWHAGHIRLLGWNRSGLIGQIVPLGPLDGSVSRQQVTVAVVAVGSLLLMYRLLRRRLGVRRALFAVAVAGAVPGFGLLATSFMTDIPAFALALACLLLADAALVRRSLQLLVWATALGLWGITIREQVVAAPVAGLATAGWSWRDDRRTLWRLAGLGALVVMAFAAFEWWRHQLPDADPPTYELALRKAVEVPSHAYYTFALYLAPALALTVRPASWTRAAKVAALLGAAASAVAAAAALRGSLLLGNYLSRSGAYSITARGDRHVFPLPVWGLVMLSALVAGALLPTVVVMHWRAVDPLLALFGILTIAGMWLEIALGQSVYDRSLLVLLPVGLMLVLSGPAHRGWLAASALAALGLLSLALTANAAAFDAARWKAAKELTASGIPPSRVDAGLEWIGTHSPKAAIPEGVPDTGADVWYLRMFPRIRPCYIVSPSSERGTRIGAYSYKSFVVAGSAKLWLYREDDQRLAC